MILTCRYCGYIYDAGEDEESLEELGARANQGGGEVGELVCYNYFSSFSHNPTEKQLPQVPTSLTEMGHHLGPSVV